MAVGVIITIVIFLLSWDQFWNILTYWPVTNWILQLFGCFVLQRVVLDMGIGRRVLTEEGERITHPRLWSWYATFVFLFGFITGFLSAVIRLFMLFGVALLALMRFDTTIFPAMLASEDVGYTSFMAVVLMHHR